MSKERGLPLLFTFLETPIDLTKKMAKVFLRIRKRRSRRGCLRYNDLDMLKKEVTASPPVAEDVRKGRAASLDFLCHVATAGKGH